MLTNLQLNRTLADKKSTLMSSSSTNRTVSDDALQQEWVEIQAAQQNPAQFRPLYDRYYDQIFRFIYRRTNSEALSSDITAQVFLKAMQKIKSYQFKGVPFSAWLYRIASNEVTQHFRNTQKNRVVSLNDVNLDNMTDDINYEDREALRNRMIQVLDTLRENDLALIEMRFFEQRPFKEIADILGITESNAKVKTYRILDRLKKKIGTV